MNIENGTYPANNITSNFMFINGIPLYAVMGKSSVVTTNVEHQIGYFTTTEARKPRYHIVEKLGSNNPSVIHGGLATSINLKWILGDPLSASLSMLGLKQHTPVWTISTPTYPSSQDDLFNYLYSCKFGADGTESELTYVSTIEMKIWQNPKPYPSENGYYGSINEWNPLECTVTLGLTGDQTTVFDAIKSRTAKSLLIDFRSSSNTNKYLKFDSNGASAYPLFLEPIKLIDSTVGFTAGFYIKNPVFNVKDYVADTFYEIPT